MVEANDVQDGECVRFLTITGLTAVVKRGHRPYAYSGDGNGCADRFQVLNPNHTGTLKLLTSPSSFREWWWNFITDPHGTDVTGTYLREDPDSSDCHEFFELATYAIGCLKDAYVTGVPIRNGNPPASFSNPFHVVNSDGGFMGSTYVASQNCNEHHPSMQQINAVASEQIMMMDMRPYICNLQHAQPDQMSHVSGRIYKQSAASSADMQYREQGFAAGNGLVPMVDVSPAVLTDTQGDEYKYCVVVIAGDCYAGSSVGEVYFVTHLVATGYETNQRFVFYPTNTLHDINLTQNFQTMNSLMQVDGTRASPYGEGTRRLSSAFASFRNQSTYWNARAFPDNKHAYFFVERLEGARTEVLIADLPPWPTLQSTNRGTGVPVSVSVGGRSGDTVRIRFGYAENGPAPSLYCHERQAACATDASGGLPYVWTDETQHWTACDTGCTVNIPAISGRVLYYMVDRKNGTTAVSGALEAALVP